MGAYDKHHFIPRFFLTAWHSGPDDRLTRMSWLPSGLEIRRCKAKGTARVPSLYALRGHPEPNVIEATFLRDLDTIAARVHQKLLNAEFLTASERTVWSNFVVSLLVRTPERLEHVRQVGAESLDKELAKKPEEYAQAKPKDAPATFSEFVDLAWPDLKYNFGVQTLPTLVQSAQMNAPISSAYWSVVELSCAKRLLLSDRPVIYNLKKSGAHLFGLPISPRHMFFAFNSPATGKNIECTSHLRIARNYNKAAAWMATKFVIGVDDTEAHMVGLHLPNPLRPKNVIQVSWAPSKWDLLGHDRG